MDQLVYPGDWRGWGAAGRDQAYQQLVYSRFHASCAGRVWRRLLRRGGIFILRWDGYRRVPTQRGASDRPVRRGTAIQFQAMLGRGPIEEEVVIGDDGRGWFPVGDGSLSVYLKD